MDGWMDGWMEPALPQYLAALTFNFSISAEECSASASWAFNRIAVPNARLWGMTL